MFTKLKINKYYIGRSIKRQVEPEVLFFVIQQIWVPRDLSIILLSKQVANLSKQLKSLKI